MQPARNFWTELLEGLMEFVVEAACQFLSCLIEAALGNLL